MRSFSLLHALCLLQEVSKFSSTVTTDFLHRRSNGSFPTNGRRNEWEKIQRPKLITTGLKNGYENDCCHSKEYFTLFNNFWRLFNTTTTQNRRRKNQHFWRFEEVFVNHLGIWPAAAMHTYFKNKHDLKRLTADAVGSSVRTELKGVKKNHTFKVE